MQPLLGRSHLGLGRLEMYGGDAASARACFTSAAAVFARADMRFWVARANALLADVGD
jgi:hypothetical protein